MGGAVVLSALASSDQPNVDGVILVAPAVWSRSDMPLLIARRSGLPLHMAPWMTFPERD